MKKTNQTEQDEILMNLRLSKNELSPILKAEFMKKILCLSKAEILVWTAIFQYNARKDLKSLECDETCDIINEGTEDEETITNEQKLKDAINDISSEAKILLKNNFRVC